MGLITPVAVSFFAIAMVAFGVQHLVYWEFVTRVVPKLPAWIPWHSFWAYLTGVVLIAAGTGGAFLVAGSPAPMIPLSRFFLSAFLVLTGVQHFLFVLFVATLVPRWIPGHLFWTYFAGVALIAGGIGMLMPTTRRMAALSSGTMIFLWVLLLHIPRALAAPHDSNETTAVFEALAISGAAFLVAARDVYARFP